MDGAPSHDLLSRRQAEESAFAAGDHTALARALAEQAALTPDPAERAGLLYRAGCAAEQAGDRAGAVQLFARVAASPFWERLARFHRLELHWRQGEWPPLAAVLAEEIAAGGDGFELEALRLERARILAIRLGRMEDALFEVKVILAANPGCREAVWLRLTLALRSGNWTEAADDYELLHRLAGEDQDLAFSLSAALRLGQIFEFHFQRLPLAAQWYGRLDAAANSALSSLPRFEMAEAAKDWPEASRLLAELIGALEAEDQEPEPGLRRALARILEDGLDDREGALAQIEAVLAVRPDDFGALYAAAERAIESGPPERRAALAARAAEQMADPKEKAVLLGDRTRVLLEDLDDPQAAAATARSWLELDPASVSAGHWLIDALARAGGFREAIAEIDRELARTGDPRERQGLLFRKAELATHKLDDHALALEAYRAALEIPPSQFPILQAMGRLYHLNRDWEPLARIVAAPIKLVAEPALKRHYQRWLGDLYLERLGRDDHAFALYGEMVKTDPGDRQALKAIARLARRKGSWPNLAGALTRVAESAADPRLRLELQSEIAWLLEVRLEQKDRALALYREAAASGDLFARQSLCRLLYGGPDLAPYASAQQALIELTARPRLRAGRLLRLASVRETMGELSEAWSCYEKARIAFMREPHLFLPMLDLAQLAGYWPRYLNLLEEFAGRLGGAMKPALLWEAAWSRSEVPDASGQVDAEAMARAFRALEEVSGASPRSLHGGFLAATWTGDAKGRADTLARLIKSAPEELAVPLKLRLARVLTDEVKAPDDGIAALRQVLAKEPRSAPVIRELSLLYRQAGQWGELIRMILQELPLRKEPALQVDIYLTLARLYEEKFSALDEAIKCQTAVLRLAPGRLESHADKARLLERRERFEELLAALAAYEQAAPGLADKIAILHRAAAVADLRLHDPDRALLNLKKALDLDPARPESLAPLVALLERESRWPELVETLAGQSERVEAASERAALRERAGEVLEEKLSDPARALEHLVQARDLDPDRLSVLLRLERLFTTASRWRELIDTLERLAVKAAEDRERASLCSRIGALWDEKLNEPEPAIASWERTRALDAGNVPAHEALVSLYERTGRAPEFVDRSAALAELVAADPGRAVALLARAGRTAEDKLKDDDRALRLYHRAMEIDPRGIPPVAAARALFERREQWSDAVAMMLRQETITAEPEKKLELLAGAGNVYERKLADQSGAAAAYERALALKGDYLPAVAPLSEIYFDRQAWARARPLYETRVLALSGIEAEPRAEIWHKAGWCAEQAGDLPAAMKRYHASVEALGEYRPSLERLSEQYTRQEQWEQAALFTERLLAVVRLVGDPEAAFILLGRAGAIELKLNRLDRATLAFEQALQLKPGHYPTLVHLVDLYRRQEQWKKALLAYDQLIQHAPAKPAAADGLYGKGEILEDKLKEENSALAHFQKAVQVAPDHLPAWNRMARLYLRRRAWPEAETSLQNVLRLDPDKGRQVENHFQLGGVYREGLRDLARARAQFEAALQLNEVHVPSMQALGDIYLELEEWDRFIATAEKFVRIVPAESQPSLLPLYFKIGEVYRDRLQNTERSIISFQQVVKLEPGNERARSELAALYVSDPKFIDQAKSENLNLIRLQPFRVQSYRDLANIYKSQRNLDAQFWLFSILKRLGSLDLEEEMFFEANQDKALKSSKRSLKELEREGMLIHPDERGPLRDLLVQIGDFLEKIFPPALEKFGAKKSCLLDEKSVSPVKDLAIEIIGNLGLEGDLNIYLVPQAAEPTVLNTNPPSLVLSQEWLGRFTAPEQRFLMGRLIEHLIDRHALALHFPMDQVVTHLALLAMAADDNVNLTVPMPAAEADKRKKILKKLITRKNKTQIEHAAQRLTQEMLALDPNAWKKTMEHTGNRAGLIVCGDLFAAIGALMKIDPRFKNLKIDELAEPAKVWEKNEYVVEMLAFSVSDPFFRLRERGGFSITT